MEKVVFIDRDGVINEDTGGDYISKPKDFKFIPKTLEALKLLSDSSYKVVIITNQGGIAKGLYTEADMHNVHKYMFKELNKKNIAVDELFYCPHYPLEKNYPEENKAYKIKCDCRKPGIGMFKQAKKKFQIDFSKSWMVGDRTTDIKAGKDAGCKTILVMTGYGGKDKKCDAKPDFTAKDLYEAVIKIILKT